jgi:mannosyl-oligosaccharide alpha-1,2-mannosidase
VSRFLFVSFVCQEFRDLSRITSNPVYENESFKVSQKLHDLPKTDGLVPIFVNVNTGMFRTFATISLGARGDSYYEYLLKQHLQMGKRTNDL